jgi:6-phosphofructokinase 1
LVDAADKIIESGVSMKRVYITEVMGKHCGYLALIGAISSGADLVFLNESGIHIEDLQRDLARLKSRFTITNASVSSKQTSSNDLFASLNVGGDIGSTSNNQRQNAFFIVRNEASSDVFTIDFLSSYFEASSEGLFEVRKSLLGNYQQGGTATGIFLISVFINFF